MFVFLCACVSLFVYAGVPRTLGSGMLTACGTVSHNENLYGDLPPPNMAPAMQVLSPLIHFLPSLTHSFTPSLPPSLPPSPPSLFPFSNHPFLPSSLTYPHHSRIPSLSISLPHRLPASGPPSQRCTSLHHLSATPLLLPRQVEVVTN